MTETIDTGDYVHHGPSGEDWVVAYVQGEHLAWCGYPFGEAKLADCTLIQKAPPAARQERLESMAKAGNDPRAEYARRRLAAAGETPRDRILQLVAYVKAMQYQSHQAVMDNSNYNAILDILEQANKLCIRVVNDLKDENDG